MDICIEFYFNWNLWIESNKQKCNQNNNQPTKSTINECKREKKHPNNNCIWHLMCVCVFIWFWSIGNIIIISGCILWPSLSGFLSFLVKYFSGLVVKKKRKIFFFFHFILWWQSLQTKPNNKKNPNTSLQTKITRINNIMMMIIIMGQIRNV